MPSEIPLAYVVFVIIGDKTCYRDSEFSERRALQASSRRLFHLVEDGLMAWIEPAYTLPFRLDGRFWIEVPKPTEDSISLSREGVPSDA
jgi:hypothetical protein